MIFFLNSYIFEGKSSGKKILTQKSVIFYELIKEICIIFLFLSHSLFSVDKSIEKFF